MMDLCCFFFQAEDGIRDDLVTGVQTCALPISLFQSSTPAPSRAPFRTRSSPNAILPASESVCAPAPSGTTGRLSPAFAHPEKPREARPCFPTTLTAENEIAGKAPKEPADHQDKAPSWEARCPVASRAAQMHSTAGARRS